MNRDRRTAPPPSSTKEKKTEAKEFCILVKKGEEVELGAPEPYPEPSDVKKDEDDRAAIARDKKSAIIKERGPS